MPFCLYASRPLISLCVCASMPPSVPRCAAMPRCLSASMPLGLNASMPLCLYTSSIPLCLYASMPPASMSRCLYASMLVCLYASVDLCLCASLPLCLYVYIPPPPSWPTAVPLLCDWLKASCCMAGHTRMLVLHVIMPPRAH